MSDRVFRVVYALTWVGIFAFAIVAHIATQIFIVTYIRR